MSQTQLPTLSIIIPAFNEQENFKLLLPSLEKQTYPKNKVEYIIINDASTDNTAKLAKAFGAKIINVNTHDIELNKGIGMHVAKNELVYWLDADMEILDKKFLEYMVKPLVDHPEVIGSFANLGLTKKDCVSNSLLRFISSDPLQCDPVYQFFSPSIQSTAIEKNGNYWICKYKSGSIPPAGLVMYRRKKLLKTAVGNDKAYIDMEALEIVVRAGYPYYAFVPRARIKHFHASNLKELIHKRLRNLNADYIPNSSHKYYNWFNPKSKKDIVKILFWIIYANLFIPELIRGIMRGIKYLDIAFLWEPIVSLTLTDTIVYGFLKNPGGRSFTTSMLKNLLSSSKQ